MTSSMLMRTLTPSKNAERIAVQYLQHEFRKILHGVRDPKIWRLIDRELANFAKTNGEGSFWNLVAAIAEGWKLKAVFRALSDTKFRWRREKVSVAKIVLTGMSPTLDTYIIKKCNRNPLLFKEAWHNDAKMRREILRTGFSTHKERDHFPILLWQAEDGIRVFDGMRRTLLAIIQNKDFVDAWVGRVVYKSGRPLISGGFGYVLSQIYSHASIKGESLDAAILRVGRTVAKDYRNGNELLRNRIANWAHDKKVKKMFLKVTK